MIELESVFGQMKNNRGFSRILLRGLPKVSLEVGWLSLAHNLLKKAAIDQSQKRRCKDNLPCTAFSIFDTKFHLGELLLGSPLDNIIVLPFFI
ncbi:transposase [Paenibacillus sp. V4I5]|uniref:transposase n=1 Tax=Paenibacillus sp. V4I5 TaxID=3042306 RepID=UPI003592F30C